MYSRFPIRFHVYSNSSKFPGVECLGTASKFGKREQNSSWLVYFLQTTPHIKEISRGVRAGRAKKCIKKGCCTCKIISHETCRFFDVLVAIAIIVGKASTKTIRDRASAPHNLKLFGFIDVCKRLGIRIRF